MSKTVLEIGNEAAGLCNLPQQTTLVGNTNQNAVRILRAVKDAAEKDVFRGAEWEILQYEDTFATDASTSYDELPADFDRFILGTIWDRTNDRPVIGPVTPQLWQKYESGLSGLSGLRLLLRVMGDAAGGKVIKIHPSTDTGTTIAFEYISNKYILDEDAVNLKDAVAKDGDTFLFDDDLVVAATTWRLLRNLGMSFADEKIEFEEMIAERRSNDGAGEVLNMQLSSVFRFTDPNIPETGYGS
jgi:hypothetical protein